MDRSPRICGTSEIGQDHAENAAVSSLGRTRIESRMNTPCQSSQPASAPPRNTPSSVEQGFVWAFVCAVLSPALFVLGSGLRLAFPAVDILRVFCPLLYPVTRLLGHHGLLQPHDIGKVLIFGQMVPWLLVGFAFGVIRGKHIASRRTWFQQRGVILCCTLGAILFCGYAVFTLFIQ